MNMPPRYLNFSSPLTWRGRTTFFRSRTMPSGLEELIAIAVAFCRSSIFWSLKQIPTYPWLQLEIQSIKVTDLTGDGRLVYGWFARITFKARYSITRFINSSEYAILKNCTVVFSYFRLFSRFLIQDFPYLTSPVFSAKLINFHLPAEEKNILILRCCSYKTLRI